MNAPDLETMLRSYYGRFAPDDSTRVVLASRTLLDEARDQRPVRPLWASSRLVAALAVAALLLRPGIGPSSDPRRSRLRARAPAQRTTSRSPTRRSAMPE